jgi:hypothetical protein
LSPEEFERECLGFKQGRLCQRCCSSYDYFVENIRPNLLLNSERAPSRRGKAQQCAQRAAAWANKHEAKAQSNNDNSAEEMEEMEESTPEELGAAIETDDLEAAGPTEDEAAALNFFRATAQTVDLSDEFCATLGS